jgi:hypothetical protein
MKRLELTINGGIGDNLMVRVFLDSVKDNYDQIAISHNTEVLKDSRNNDIKYCKFLNDLSNILFITPPYKYEQKQFDTSRIHSFIVNNSSLIPQKPNIDSLCKGALLSLDEEYIVITTHVRYIPKQHLYTLLPQLLMKLKELSNKYKIVIMGERAIEEGHEYSHQENINNVYSIYKQIVSGINSERIIDLTIPFSGLTAPDIKKLQQDCLLMQEAKFVITLGVGGNFWLALSVANTIAFRVDLNFLDFIPVYEQQMKLLDSPKIPSTFLTKDWNMFLGKLQ